MAELWSSISVLSWSEDEVWSLDLEGGCDEDRPGEEEETKVEEAAMAGAGGGVRSASARASIWRILSASREKRWAVTGAAPPFKRRRCRMGEPTSQLGAGVALATAEGILD